MEMIELPYETAPMLSANTIRTLIGAISGFVLAYLLMRTRAVKNELILNTNLRRELDSIKRQMKETHDDVTSVIDFQCEDFQFRTDTLQVWRGVGTYKEITVTVEIARQGLTTNHLNREWLKSTEEIYVAENLIGSCSGSEWKFNELKNQMATKTFTRAEWNSLIRTHIVMYFPPELIIDSTFNYAKVRQYLEMSPTILPDWSDAYICSNALMMIVTDKNGLTWQPTLEVKENIVED
jgi:hypothetical protein